MFYDYIAENLTDKFEFYNYNNAVEILAGAYQDEWWEICDCLSKLTISIEDLRQAGGNETNIPKTFDEVLYPYNWREIRMSGDLHLKFYPRRADQRGRFEDHVIEERIIDNYIDGHNIDFLKNKVAFDLEWNSKDQTFDRDIMAMRTFYECGIISVGIIVTRSKELDDVFQTIYDFDEKTNKWKNIKRKYGASTTWMGKLTSRLDSRRNGGCPIVAIGIQKPCIHDWSEDYIDEHAE